MVCHVAEILETQAFCTLSAAGLLQASDHAPVKSEVPLCLKPVLVELGATCLMKGLYILDSVYADGVAMDEWAKAALPKIAASTATHFL